MNTKVTALELVTITASAAVAQALQIASGSAVQKAVRVHSTAEGPLSHITMFAGFPTNALTGQSLVVSHGWFMQ